MSTTKLARPVAADQRPPVVMMARVTRNEEIVPPVGQNGTSIGTFLDQYMAGIAEDGGIVENFSLEIDPDFFRGMYTPRADHDAFEA